MIFLKASLWPWLVLGVVGVSIALLWSEHRFFKWVQAHWFFRRRMAHVLSSCALLIGFGLMTVVLLDPRSGEIRIKGKVRQDRTIIMIDTSTSMLVEDVRPNRLEKAVLVAKHFVRKAVGHEVSIMVFADITKKLVPFTSDLDLLDARLDSIRMLRNLNAGSSIGLAIEEAVQYFDPKDSALSGNILVISDGEDTADTEAFKVPDGISLALVGVGTKAGGPIPLKDHLGMFYGQKKSQGVTVISKLNEDFFLSAVRDQKNSKFFPVQSYDLPTNSILDFFSQKKGEEKEGENLIRPVALEVWCVPALVILAIAYCLRFLKPFALVLCLALPGAWAQVKEEAPEIPPEVQEKIQQLKDGSLDREERINLADQLVKLRMHDMAQGLYDENLVQEDIKERPESYFNWATSELETGKFDAALRRYDELEAAATKDESKSDLVKRIRANIKRAIVPPPKKDKQDKKDDKNEKEENKDQKGSGSEDKGEESKGGQSKENKPGKSGESEDKAGDKNPFDPKNKDKGDEDKQEQGKDKEQSGADGEKDKTDTSMQPDEGKEGERKKAKAKLSPLLEQLKQDDRILQLKLLDTSTQKRTERKKKDW